ncbi:eukaryotic sulfide quinone oxidoreductase [Malassezia cuniculi]|uniref:Sulfide:quinone oxidoreductase, mitochondrial n=1 Tax=Malassezia cuniculi TaxID=948313 RepID=A0AAF0EZ29_9BASI|nr:eukaryotic sulfide quinone oxidoreductase [Malassezia cuniculi]
MFSQLARASISPRTAVRSGALAAGFATSAARDAAHKVVVVGAGSAGLSVSAQLLRKGTFAKDDIAIVDPAEYHHYQPGWTLVGGGLKTREELRRPLASLVDPKVRFYQDAVTQIRAKDNTVVTSSGEELNYEHLIVASGYEITLDSISGLREALSKPNPKVTSIYTYDSVDKVFPSIQALTEGTALFTQPSSPIKCAGAPQKIMWLAVDYWKKAGLFDSDPAKSKIKVSFETGMPTMFSVPKYNEVLEQLRVERGVDAHYKHNLTAIEDDVAVFSVPDAEPVRRKFDLLHVTPTMAPPKFISESGIANAAGYVDVDQGTLRHVSHPNVWSIGDSSSLPTSKTVAAITGQAPVLVENVLLALEGKEPTATYDGYTSCPLITEYGKVLLAEFVYGLQPKESFNGVLGIDQGQPQRLFYNLKKDFFPWVYYSSHVKGTWAGPKGWSFGGRRSFSTSVRAQRNTPVRHPRDPLHNNPNASRFALNSGETFIVRPPPSAISARATVESVESFFEGDAKGAAPAAPLVNRRKENSYKTPSPEEIAAIQELRAQDPVANSVGVLSKRFGCSPHFVSKVAPAPKKHLAAQVADLELRKATWGMNKRISRIEREERRALW